MTADLRKLLEQEAQRVHPRRAPIDGVLADGTARLRRRRRVGSVLVTALTAVVLSMTPWMLGLVGDDGDTVDRPLEADPMPPWGAYYAAGDVVLGDVKVEARDFDGLLVTVPDGAVYASGSGTIVLVERDGTKTVIGERVPTHSGLASDPDTGWVSWLEGREGGGELVVYDTTVGESGRELARRPVGPAGGQDCSSRTTGQGPVAIDDGTVFFCGTDGLDFAWPDPANSDELEVWNARCDEPSRTLPDPPIRIHLLDNQAGTAACLASQSGQATRTSLKFYDGSHDDVVIDHDLWNGFLSPSARYIAAFPHEELKPLAVYETTTGERLETGLPAGTPVFAMTFDTEERAIYAVGDGWEDDSLDIVACDVPSQSCRTVVPDIGQDVHFANGVIQ